MMLQRQNTTMMKKITALQQDALATTWEKHKKNKNRPYTLIILPSHDNCILSNQALLPGYEERFMSMLLLLKKSKNLHLIYLISNIINQDVIDYYLALSSPKNSEAIKKRLSFISINDATSANTLAQRILKNPVRLSHIKAEIDKEKRGDAFLYPFNVEESEIRLARLWKLPIYGAHLNNGLTPTKSFFRYLCAQINVATPPGIENIGITNKADAEKELITKIAILKRQYPAAKKFILKINNGYLGQGNATFLASGLKKQNAFQQVAEIKKRLHSMEFPEATINYNTYLTMISKVGCVIEVFIAGTSFHSPSVQIDISPDKTIRVLSTHDQIMSDSNPFVHKGGSFPADPSYATNIIKEGRKIAEQLAEKYNVSGYISIDFAVIKKASGAWKSYAIDLNFHRGASEQPIFFLKHLVKGRYIESTSIFVTQKGEKRYCVSCNALSFNACAGISTDKVIQELNDKHLFYNDEKQTGAILYMLSTLSTSGHAAIAAIERSPEQARSLLNKTINTLKSISRQKTSQT